jgi:uncharacterized protein (DUF362 family)/Pyruvate/2-oxoacid:ferredoxin oxidoreductase delta subunit
MRSVVSIVRCPNYNEEEVLRGLREAVGLIGGMAAFVKPGNRVLLKPNLIFGKPPEKAVTTHPSIVGAVIRMVREAGGVPSIGDSPGLGGVSRAAEKAGIKKVAEETKCPLIDFNRPELPRKTGGEFFKRLEIDKAVLEADVVINLPKWKTHAQALLTLGVKNLFGCVPGAKKALWHLQAGEDRERFAQVLVDLYQVIHPSLTILDGVVGMEGDGPSSGDPIGLGLILAGTDALSLDQIVCDLLAIPRKTLVTNQVAFERGLGKDEIEVRGENPNEIKIPNYKLPSLCRMDWRVPGFLKKGLKNALSSRPVVEKEVCKLCQQCVEMCPPKAIDSARGQPEFDYGKCIRCYCCQEICPESAIRIEPGWALKLMGRRQ